MSAVGNILLGVLLGALAAFATFLMLQVFGGQLEAEQRERIGRRHRRLGWGFVVLYLGMLAVMVAKLLDFVGVDAGQAQHIALAIAVLPLLAVKLLIVRRFKPLYKLLPALGICIFVGVFTMVALGINAHLLHRPRNGGSTAAGRAAADPDTRGRLLLEQRCTKCHTLERVFALSGQLTPAAWEAVVDRMVGMDASLEEVREPLVAYLQAALVAPAGGDGELRVGAALVAARCSRCHTLERVFTARKTMDQWRATVVRYGTLLGKEIPPREVEQIARFLGDNPNALVAPGR